MYTIKWTDDEEQAIEKQTEEIKRGKGKQQRAEMSEKDGEKTEIEGE